MWDGATFMGALTFREGHARPLMRRLLGGFPVD